MTVNKTQIYQVIEEALKKPAIPHEPQRQSLKAWAMYCLRDRGFKVVYAQNADFAVETRDKEKMYFKVSNQVSGTEDSLDNQYSWIIWDSNNQDVSLIPSGI
ncbi:MAG: hypothetical protein ACFB02_02885 [Mastigocoleus sp.]